MLSSLLEVVYPMSGDEGGEDQRKEDWQPEVQQLCMDLQQLLTRMEEVLADMEDAVEKASGIEDLVNLASLPQKDQLSQSLHPSRPRARAQVL